MAISDLIKDEKTGKLSHTKIWSNIGLAAMTAVFIYRGFFGNIADMEMELLVYGIVVTAPNLLGKFLNMRFNGGVVEQNNIGGVPYNVTENNR